MPKRRTAARSNAVQNETPTGRCASSGRFTKGNRAAVGRSKPRSRKTFEAALRSEATEDDVAAVIRKLIDLAIGGDVGAARLVLAHTVGRAPLRVQHDEHDDDEMDEADWQIFF